MIPASAAVAAALWAAPALADPPPPTVSDAPGRAIATPGTADPTGGAYTSPTLLFIPAAAVPAWNTRVIASTELQSPSDVHAGFRPGLGGELGLPLGITIGAGTNWVGGDVNPNTGANDFNLGLSPYFQGRFHIYGDRDGRGFQLGTSLTYKFVGFERDPGEMELAMSAQYRHSLFELGLQGVAGQDFGDARSHDGEVHAYAVVRVIPQLAVGAAGQVRVSLAPIPNDPNAKTPYDVIGGGIASLTLGRFQVGALGGATTLGIDPGHLGGLGQLFASARF